MGGGGVSPYRDERFSFSLPLPRRTGRPNTGWDDATNAPSRACGTDFFLTLATTTDGRGPGGVSWDLTEIGYNDRGDAGDGAAGDGEEIVLSGEYSIMHARRCFAGYILPSGYRPVDIRIGKASHNPRVRATIRFRLSACRMLLSCFPPAPQTGRRLRPPRRPSTAAAMPIPGTAPVRRPRSD